MFHVVGPAAERRVPEHGLLPHSRVAGFHRCNELVNLSRSHRAVQFQHGKTYLYANAIDPTALAGRATWRLANG